MLNQILFKNQDKKQLVIAMIGAFLGITFLIASIHYLIKVNDFGKGADILGPNTIIVQKKVSNSSSLGMTKTDFSLRELEKIKAEPFVVDAQPIIANNFDISFQTDDKLVPYFRSDVFIQTIDKQFLDVKTTNWEWEATDEFCPIILPRDFIVMLNTFMSAEGIPQVSDDLAMQINFKFRLQDPTGRKEYVKAKIVGFTNEVASILVPRQFMTYGNENFSDGSVNKITQIMISGKESEFGLVEKLLQSRGLESKNAQMVVGRLKSVVGTLFLVVLGISIIAVFVSGLVLIQYLQLLLSKNAYEVRTLLRMGYAPADLIKQFTKYFAIIFGIVSALGILVFLCLKFYLDGLFASGGLYIDTQLSATSIIALILAYGLFVLSSYRNAKRGIYGEY
jgi:hypothetical protein